MLTSPRCLVVLPILVLAGCQSGGAGGHWFSNSDPASADREVESRPDLIPAAEANPVVQKSAEPSGAQPVVAKQRLESLVAAGQSAIREQRYDAARAAFTEVLQSSPGHTTAHHGLAIVADLTEDWVEAEYHYKQALRNQPRDANLLNDLGYSYLLQNRLHESTRYLSQAVEIEPQHEHAQINLALLSLKQGDRDSALARLSAIFPAATAAQHLTRLDSQVREMAMAEDPAGVAEPPRLTPDTSFEEVMELAAEQRRAAEQAREQRYAAQEPQSSIRFSDPRFYDQSADPASAVPGGSTGRHAAAGPSGVAASAATAAGATGPAGPQWPGHMPSVPVHPSVAGGPPGGAEMAAHNTAPGARSAGSPSVPNPPPSEIIPAATTSSAPAIARRAPGGVEGPVLQPLGAAVSIQGRGASRSDPSHAGSSLPQSSYGASPSPTGHPVQPGRPQSGMAMSGQADPVWPPSGQALSANATHGAATAAYPNSNSGFAPAAQAPVMQAPAGMTQGATSHMSADPSRMPLAGLDAGPGSLFPVQPAPSGVGTAAAPVANGQSQGVATHHGVVQQPGANSLLNGGMFPEVPRVMSGYQHITPASATQGPPTGAVSPAAGSQTASPAGSGNPGLPAGWVQPPATGVTPGGAAPANSGSAPPSAGRNLTAPDPLTDYERQLQQREAPFQQTLQQMREANSTVQPVQARY